VPGLIFSLFMVHYLGRKVAFAVPLGLIAVALVPMMAGEPGAEWQMSLLHTSGHEPVTPREGSFVCSTRLINRRTRDCFEAVMHAVEGSTHRLTWQPMD